MKDVESEWNEVSVFPSESEQWYLCKVDNHGHQFQANRKAFIYEDKVVWMGGCRPFSDNEVVTHWKENIVADNTTTKSLISFYIKHKDLIDKYLQTVREMRKYGFNITRINGRCSTADQRSSCAKMLFSLLPQKEFRHAFDTRSKDFTKAIDLLLTQDNEISKDADFLMVYCLVEK